MKFSKPTIKAFLIASSVALAVPLAVHARGGMDGGDSEWGGHRGQQCESGMMKHGGGHRGHHGKDMGMMRGLDLSEAQRDQIFELRHALAPKMREEMKVVRASREQLREMAMAGSYDDAKVKELTEAGAAAKARMAQMRLKNQHEVFQLLTPEQREKMAEMRAKRGAGKGKRDNGERERGGQRSES